MIAQRFAPGKQIMRGGETLEIARQLPGNQIQLENITSGAVITANLNELIGDLYDGRLEFVVEGKGSRKAQNGQPNTEVKYLPLSDCPPELLGQAEFRLKVIRPLLDIEHRSRSIVVARVREIRADPQHGRKKVSVTSVYGWIRDYERGDRDLRSLIPNTDERGGKGQWRTDKTVERIITEVIDQFYRTANTTSREKKTVSDIWLEVCRRIDEENKSRFANEQLHRPSLTTVCRRVNALDTCDEFAARHGKRAAQKQFSQYGKGPEAERPGERVEIDHTLTDIIVIDELDNLALGRMTLTDCLDVSTRYPLGFYLGFEPPGYYAVNECLYHAILPKTGLKEKYGLEHEWLAHGIPGTLVTDNGKEFIGKSLGEACRDLDVVLEQMPIKHPHFKGKVERLFRSVAFQLHGLPGTTFSNTNERGDYDSVGQACLYLGEVKEILTRFFVDIYAERLHKGIDAVPARRWEAFIANGYQPRVPASAEKLRILLGQTIMRTVQHYGIDFECLRYNSPELSYLRSQLKGQDTAIRIHPGDIRQIYVRDPFSNEYLAVPAEDPVGYTTGLSLWKHRVIHRRVLEQRDKVDLASLIRAKGAIQEIVDTARTRKPVGTRAKIARWDRGGKPPSLEGQTSTSPALPPSPPVALPETQYEPIADASPLNLSETEVYAADYLPLRSREA